MNRQISSVIRESWLSSSYKCMSVLLLISCPKVMSFWQCRSRRTERSNDTDASRLMPFGFKESSHFVLDLCLFAHFCHISKFWWQICFKLQQLYVKLLLKAPKSLWLTWIFVWAILAVQNRGGPPQQTAQKPLSWWHFLQINRIDLAEDKHSRKRKKFLKQLWDWRCCRRAHAVAHFLTFVCMFRIKHWDWRYFCQAHAVDITFLVLLAMIFRLVVGLVGWCLFLHVFYQVIYLICQETDFSPNKA